MVDSLGLERGILRLVEYDARWPTLFASEQERIRSLCGTLPITLEHIGGTAIPAMCSKPILDMAAGRPSSVPFPDYVAAFTRSGYEHRGERGVAGRELFCLGDPRAYHLHLVEQGGTLWRQYLAFRDYLRAHPDAAREFAAFKRTLAERFANDREGYMHEKSSRVESILRLAGAPL